MDTHDNTQPQTAFSVWHFRYFLQKTSQQKVWRDTVIMLQSMILEYFPDVPFYIDVELTPNFRIYPFNTHVREDEPYSLFRAFDINKPVVQKGDLLGFHLPGGRKLDPNAFLSLAYKEQLVGRLTIYWHTEPDEVHEKLKKDISQQTQNAFWFIISSLSIDGAALLSLQIEGSTESSWLDISETVHDERLFQQGKTPSSLESKDPAYQLECLPKSYLKSSALALQSLFDRIDEKSIFLPLVSSEWGTRDNEKISLIMADGVAYSFRTQLIKTEKTDPANITLIVDSSGAPLWHLSNAEIEGQSVQQWSRLIKIPSFSTPKEWLSLIRQYPCGFWFGDDGWNAANYLSLASASQDSTCMAWSRFGFAIERTIDENGKQEFSLYLEDDEGFEQHFFQGGIIDIVHYFDKLSELNKIYVPDVEDAISLSSSTGCLPSDESIYDESHITSRIQ